MANEAGVAPICSVYRVSDRFTFNLHKRDAQCFALTRELKQHEWFAQVPTQVLGGFAELLAISRELRAGIKAQGGAMQPDGTPHPSVEQFRKIKHTELNYLQTMMEMRRAEHEEPRDLVAEMARCDEVAPEPEAVEPEQTADPED